MAAHTSDSLVTVPLLQAAAVQSARDSIESNVLALFDGYAPQLLRYVGSLGLGVEETEDVVQDTFLALFRHLTLDRDQSNLHGWLFQVAHNLALKRREQVLRQLRISGEHHREIRACVDPSPGPEEQLMRQERDQRLRAVFRALPERDRRCLSLRAEGLTYRDIARVLSVSLGAVSKTVSRSLTRLMNADGG